jgi:CopA family copper-resistance protein
MQEQTGLQGAMIIDPIRPGRLAYGREYVVQLADWTDEDPMTVIANLKQQGSYYNYHQRTLGTFVSDVERDGFGATLKDRLMWGGMRMDPTDIADVSGSLFTYLVNGLPPAANWTASFRPGERVRLRFINGASMTIFDVRIPGLMLSIVQADGTDVEPVEVEEFRIAAAETYDVIVTPGDGAYTIFAQSIDRSGYARGTLTSRPGQIAPVPAMDPPPLRSMADMGMAHASDHAEMDHAVSGMDGMSHDMSMGHMPGHMREMDHTPGMDMGAALAPQTIPSVNASGVDPARLAGQPFVESVVAQPTDRLGEAGTGMDGNGRKNLRYSQLRALTPAVPPLVPTRAIVFHLTGNMERWVWGFDGKTFSDAPPVRVALGETVRFVLINDTMMEHPIHLHGFLFTLENGQGARQPLKHTVNVKPAEKVAFVFKADVPGHWAFHCHLLYHMEMGMFRTVLVA